MAKFHVLMDGENVWTIDGKPDIFNSASAAALELAEHFKDMEDANMFFNPLDYQIEEITQ